MDVLVALGSTVAYAYSVVVLLAPPVPQDLARRARQLVLPGAAVQVAHPHVGRQRQRLVRRGHRMHVVGFAARSSAAMKRLAIP